MNLPRATLLLQQGRFELAEQYAQRAVAEQPNSGGAHAVLALCLLGRERYKPAHDAARRAVHLDPDEGFGHFVLGMVLAQDEEWVSRGGWAAALVPGNLARRRLRLAEASAREAIRCEPDAENYHRLLARVLFALDRRHESLMAVDRALQIDPEDPDSLTLRADLLRALGRYDQAMYATGESMSANPGGSNTHTVRGWTLYQAGRQDEAAASFREALRLDPNDGSAREGLMQCLRHRRGVSRVMGRAHLWMATRTENQKRLMGAGAFAAAFGVGALSKIWPWAPGAAMLLATVAAVVLILVAVFE